MLLAQVDLTDPNQNPLVQRFGTIGAFLNVVLPLLTLFAALAFLAMLLYGTFTWMTAGGNPEKVKKSAKILGFSVAGFFIMVFAYFFVKLLTNLLNISTALP